MAPFSFIPLSAGIMRGPFYLVLWVLALLTGCHVTESLLLAGLPDAPSNALLVVDGQGPEARFGSIDTLEIDSQGNLYVLDKGPERNQGNISVLTSAAIRKITPEGKVTTLIGRGTGQTLIGNMKMIIREDILYISSAGCLLKADLKQEPPSFQAFYGTCLSEKELQRLKEQVQTTGTPISVATTFEGAYIRDIMPEKTIYFSLSPINSKGPGPYFKLLPDETVVLDPNRRYFPAEGLFGNFVMDSRGMIYGTTLAMPGPGGAGPTRLYQTSYPDISAGVPNVFHQTLYVNQLKSPGALAIDNRDYLYVLDQDGLFKRFSPQGEMVVIGNVRGLQGPKDGLIAAQKVNHQRTWLYFATLTAVYKIPLPPPLPPQGENHETK
jgi:hypothetical protein